MTKYDAYGKRRCTDSGGHHPTNNVDRPKRKSEKIWKRVSKAADHPAKVLEALRQADA